MMCVLEFTYILPQIPHFSQPTPARYRSRALPPNYQLPTTNYSLMNIQHFERNFAYTGRELPTVARKIGKIATYCKRVKDSASAIRVEVERQTTRKERDQIMVIVTVELPEKILRAESRKNDVIDALDRCIEKLEPQVKRYKDLRAGKGRTQRANPQHSH